MIETVSIFNVGFSIVAAMVLLLSYYCLSTVNKSPVALASCTLLLIGISYLQLNHYWFLVHGPQPALSQPLDILSYRVWLLVIPPTFYFFCRAILFPDEATRPYHLLQYAPVPLAFFASRDVAVPVAYLLGTAYCLWLSGIVFRLRHHRKQFGLVFLCFGLFSLLAIIVLILGFSATYIDNKYFYYFYLNGIALSFMVTIAVLIIFPNAVGELHEVVKLGYSSTTLANVNVEETLNKLRDLMEGSKLYQDETLSLGRVAMELDLSKHQLSELINSHFHVSFSKYIRMYRVEAAKHLLIKERDASILSISLETGFKSQSNFYAAFKELTGESPGTFRKKHA